MTGTEGFARFFGGAHPLLVILASTLVGAVLLFWLGSRGWFRFYRPGHLPARLGVWAVAALLAGVTIGLDSIVRFPSDINVRFPASLYFYPAIAVVVEVVFHLLPLTVALVVLTAGPFHVDNGRAVAIAIGLTALLEPAFQVTSMIGSARYPLWAPAFLAVHLAVFNLLQLVALRRLDFLTTLGARMAYYGIWHVAWGWLRLRTLS